MRKIILFTLLSIVITQNTWGNGTIATSDNLDGLYYNPAALAIDHGDMNAVFIQPDSDGEFSKNSIFHRAHIFKGFGFSSAIDRTSKIFKPETWNSWSLGGAITPFDNFNIGASYNNFDQTKLGFIYRPHNTISLGGVLQFGEESYKSIGVAIRPLSSHAFTLGADFRLSDDESPDFIFPFVEFQPLDGLRLSISTKLDTEQLDDIDFNSLDLNMNLGFVIDSENEFFTSTISNSNSKISKTGIGTITTTHKKPTLATPAFGEGMKLLKVNLEGTFIEEPPKVNKFNFSFPMSFGLFGLSNDNTPGIQLRTWINEMDRHTKDDKIDGMVIELGSVVCGFSKRQEIRDALMRFKESGKKIYVYSNGNITNSSYYLVSMADEIYIHEQNSVFLNGVAANFVFYKGMFDKWDITPVVYRVQKEGKSYKGAVDQFIEKSITDEMKEEYNKIFDNLYYVFTRDIAENRGWTVEKVQGAIDNGPYLIADKAVEAGLITDTMYPDEFKEYINKLAGNNSTEDSQAISMLNENINIDSKRNFIEFKPYRASNYVYDWKMEDLTNIAIIYAVGGIIPGESNPGPKGSTMMGDKTISKAFKDAYEDEKIDAVILRIDSGGGSALASDMMWRQMVKSKEKSKTKKPFIVSMSDVAASGGYYIATEADKIIANETTITGSIGVISFWPNISKMLEKQGITFDDSIKRGEHADFKYITLANRLHNDYEKEKIQESLNHTYDIFKTRVVDGRKNLNDIDELDDIALGRIWTGIGAQKVLLADEVGGLNTAIEITKEMLNETGSIMIHEYPKMYNSSMDFSFDSNEVVLFPDLLPEAILKDIDIMEKLPVIYSDDMLMMVPFEINID